MKKNMESIFLKRNLHIENYCNDHEHEKNFQYGITRRLIIDRHNKITWCPICKAGSTVWMKIFAMIGNEIEPDIELPNPNVQISKLAKKAFPFLGYTETYDMLNKTTKFIIIRHPFERLLSAYRDKLEDTNKTYYFNNFGKHIIKWYRQKESNNTAPTFEEFLLYIVNEKSFDEHWNPYFRECAPCFVKYDIIVKLENMDDEQQYLVNYLLNSNRNIKKLHNFDNTNVAGRTNYNIKKLYFSQIPLELLRNIYKIYEKDFSLFEYSPDEYFALCKIE